jgi:hypothetical protein
LSPITVRAVQADPIAAEDERRHRPGPRPTWEESWYLDFAAADGSLAGYVRLGLRPAEGVAWFWAGVVGAGPALVAVRDHEVPLPSGRALEVRASGLWTELVCETPLDHWSVGLEAFGVALDDPAEAWRGERGDPWALGLDVEWEAAAPASAWPGDGHDGYAQACDVHGDVLVGRDRFQLDGTGVRIHLWGDRDWAAPWVWAAGRLSDGAAFLVAGDDDVQAEPGADGRLRRARVGGITAAAVGSAPVLVDRGGRLDRAFCRYEAADGRSGHGWVERLT